MACEIVGISQSAGTGCGSAIGGFIESWIFDIEELDPSVGAVVTNLSTTNIITAFTLLNANVVGHFYHSQNNTAFNNSTAGDPGAENASNVSMEFVGATAEKIACLNKLRACCGLVCVVKNKSGTKFVYGIQFNYDTLTWERAANPLRPKISMASGATATDYEKLVLELVGGQLGLPLTCTIADSDLTAL